MRKFTKQGGFTLVELLVVIGILALLTAIVLVAVNPGRQFAQARDTQRRADVTTISSAIVAYMADPINNGQFPPSMAAVPLCSVPPAANIGTGLGNVALSTDVTTTYVAAIPMDPVGGTAADTGYDICILDPLSRRLTISAPNYELAPAIISVTR